MRHRAGDYDNASRSHMCSSWVPRHSLREARVVWGFVIVTILAEMMKLWT